MKLLSTLILGGILFLSGCREEDSVEAVCSASCTVITGRFTTDGGRTGLANVPLELEWVNFNGVAGATVHRKARATTDANGNYTLRFHISDNELNDGVYKLHYRVDTKSYITDRDSQGLGVLGADIKRDTVITSNWLLPRKAYLHLEVTNPVQASEYFAAEYGFRLGNFSTIGRFNYGIVSMLYSPGRPTTATADVEIAANQPVELKVDKTKGGQRSIQRDTIQLTPGARYVHRITY